MMPENIEGNYWHKHTSKNPVVVFLMKIFHDGVVEFINGVSPKNILDVGCGEGYTTAIIKQKILDSEIEGIELGTKALTKAQSLHKNIKFEQGSAYSIKREDDSYDLVSCTEVLEHLEDPLKALLELKRVSKRFVLISVPNEPWWRIANVMRGYYLKDFGNTPGHINHWSKKSLADFLKPNFSKVKIKNAILWNIALCEKK